MEDQTTMQWLSVKEVALELNVAIVTVRTWIYKSKIRSHKIGKLVRISRENLDQFILASERPKSQN
jgi:excisionase family DNA binding protein